MRYIVSLIAVLLVAGCASPTLQMNDADITALNDGQVCHYQNSYNNDPRVDAESERRGLICDPYVRECMRRGNAPGSEAMSFCVGLLHENERLRYDRYYGWQSLHHPHAAFEGRYHH